MRPRLRKLKGRQLPEAVSAVTPYAGITLGPDCTLDAKVRSSLPVAADTAAKPGRRATDKDFMGFRPAPVM
jgi:hypothetical protein